MKMDKYDVRVIRWDRMDARHWGKVIDSIPVSGYVRDLPYFTPPNVPCIVIPVETGYNRGSLTFMVETRFMKVRMQDKSFIWRRTE